MNETKTLQGVAVKDADKGTVEAIFSTFNVVDLDGDVTRPGAFQDGAAVRISAYGHASWGQALPVGKGVIRVTDQGAVLDGKFFLDTQQGRDTFTTVKEMGDLQEWSYGYDVEKSGSGTFEGEDVRFLEELKVHEVSPVMLGAGIDTRTLAVKSSIPFSDQAEHVLGDLQILVCRAKAFGSQSTDQERKEGRVLSAANRERLATLVSALREAGVEIDGLLADTDPQKHAAAIERIAHRSLIRDRLLPSQRT